MAKSLEQVHGEFQEASDAQEWFMMELCEFFTALSVNEQLEVLDRIDADFEWLEATNFEPGETTSWELEVFRGTERKHVTAFTETPPAIGLLDCLVGACELGDEIRIKHSRAGLEPVDLDSVWPFGMDEALRLTSPRPEEARTWDEAFELLEQDAS